ncbi:MAG: hypothetical protein WCK02_08465 [Bacteroidota bacterium]
MIQEIVNFIEHLEEKSPEIFSENLELKEGLYIFLEKEGDELVIKDENILNVDNKTEKYALLYNQFLERYTNSEMITNKSMNAIEKIFIDVGSPFGISISGKGLKPQEKEKKGGLKIMQTLEERRKEQENALKSYITSVKNYTENLTEQQKLWFEKFTKYLNNEFFKFFDKNGACLKEEKGWKYNLKFRNYEITIKDTFLFYFFLKDPEIKDYQDFYSNYLSTKVFLYDLKKDEAHGIINDLNVGNIDNKPFLRHKSASFDVNYKVDGFTAKKVYQFFRLKYDNQVLPNPFPLFVDKQELTQEVVKFFKNDKTKGHKEIIEHLLNEREKDLQNYYLVYFKYIPKNKKEMIYDLDFVPVFRYKTDDMPIIKAIFKVKSKGELLKDFKIDNIFDFQSNILNKVFNKQLLQETKNGLRLKYFDDLKISNYATETIVDLFYKYRKTLYDYVYKSKRQAITYEIFYEIMSNSILDDIHRDKEFKRTTDIKEKLNIWFSLYNYFVNSNNNTDMVNKTEQLFERLKIVAKPENSSERIRTNDEFAFASGQIIWKLLIQNESANRTHALLEPFLQKSDANLFKQAIARTYDSYKHKLTLYPKKYEFDKIMGEVMGFDTKENIKNLLPLILAGYFSETIFKKEVTQEN